MWKLKELEALVQQRLSKRRAKHVLCVRDCAVALAKRYYADIPRVAAAALLHDITKEESKQHQLQTIAKSGIILGNVIMDSPQLYHAITGQLYAQTVLGISDEEVLGAIRYHTTARVGMTLTEQIVFVADAVSADRSYKGVEQFRRLAAENLDQAMLALLQHTLRYLVKDTLLIPMETIDAYHEYVKKIHD